MGAPRASQASTEHLRLAGCHRKQLAERKASGTKTTPDICGASPNFGQCDLADLENALPNMCSESVVLCCTRRVLMSLVLSGGTHLVDFGTEPTPSWGLLKAVTRKGTPAEVKQIVGAKILLATVFAVSERPSEPRNQQRDTNEVASSNVPNPCPGHLCLLPMSFHQPF